MAQCADWIRVGRAIAIVKGALLAGCYIGEHQGSLREGRGMFINKDMSTYFGDWRQGKRSGKGWEELGGGSAIYVHFVKYTCVFFFR